MGKIILISAICKKNFVIGNDNKIPWYINEEFKIFKEKTSNQIVIYGKNTWESIPKKFRPLPDRINIVITRNKNLFLENKNLFIFDDLQKAINFCKIKFFNKIIFLCGGQKIYEEGLKFCDMMYLSFIKKKYDGDIFFPKFDKDKFIKIYEKDFDEFIFCEYKKK